MTEVSPQTPSDAVEAPPAKASLLETWGAAAVVTILALFAVEMAVLTPMVRFGVDLSGFLGWINSTFGSEIDVKAAGSSWWLAAGVAYAITRPLKPVQLLVAVPLTPVVARVTGLAKPEADPSTDEVA